MQPRLRIGNDHRSNGGREAKEKEGDAVHAWDAAWCRHGLLSRFDKLGRPGTSRAFFYYPHDRAIPLFALEPCLIDRRFGFIRPRAATDAAAYDGPRLRRLAGQKHGIQPAGYPGPAQGWVVRYARLPRISPPYPQILTH